MNIVSIKRRLTYPIIKIYFVIFTSAMFATNSDALYVAKINVPNRSLEARKVAIRLGLAEVIKRVTSDENVMGLMEIENILEKPDNYLQSYGYMEENSELAIKMNFNIKQINSMLRELEISPWIKRPEILLWVFIDGRSLAQLRSNTVEDVVNIITQISSKVGLPIYFPLGDLEEEQEFGNINIIQSQELIENLSKKYAKEVIVVSNMQHVLEGWNISWMLYTQAETQHWVDEDFSLELAIKSGFTNIANLLKERFHLSSSYGITEIKFSVRNISSNKAYKRVQSYLSKLSIVDSVNIISLKKQNVTFQVNLTQDVNKFREVLELNEQLEFAGSINPEYLIYEFKP